MFGRLMPRETRFFEFFNAHAEQIVLGARELSALIDDIGGQSSRAATIDEHEGRADKITHETLALLHTSFVTPFDREDIHALITGMDDILDMIQDVTESLTLYDIHRVTSEAKQLAELCVSCCDSVKATVALLHDMKNSADIMRNCREIDRLESDADRVMRTAMSKLFRDEPDVREVIKLKAIYEQLEVITDRCNDVANIVEGIVLENA